jgi:acetolactate synthase-1/2/3 large subunit
MATAALILFYMPSPINTFMNSDKPIRVSEYIAQTLVAQGIRHIFMLTGGGAMFLNDALGHQSGLEAVCCHHEQACAMAAEAYARINNQIGVINVTTGPGGINAMNGVFGAWTDSIPMLILSGQVKRETHLGCVDLPMLRQLGDQEANIIPMVSGITKYACTVKTAEQIVHELGRALYLARSGRPGPCWLDIPIDVQSAFITPSTIAPYLPEQDIKWLETRIDPRELEPQARFILEKIAQAERPVLLAGSGIRIGQALGEFETAIQALGIPVVTAWTHDLIASDDPLFCGRQGSIGTRAGNFTVQNADLLLVLGSRLNIRQTSYNTAAFARHAEVIQVDIDPAELNKPTYRPQYALIADVRPLLAELSRQIARSDYQAERFRNWLAWCKARLIRYPGVTPRQREYHGKINPYHFVDTLFNHLDADDIVACGNATACIVPFQVAQLKKGQRLFSNSGSASMGYDLPAAIGAWYGAQYSRGSQRRVICLAGDGSLQLNIQELQTVAHHQLPIKIFVLNNRGYLSIRSSQNNFFGRLIGESPSSGVSFPDFCKVAQAYGLPASRLNQAEFGNEIEQILAEPGPYLCEVILDDTQGFEPRMSSRQLPDGRIISPPLEDMYPFLSAEELAENMLLSTPPSSGNTTT